MSMCTVISNKVATVKLLPKLICKASLCNTVIHKRNIMNNIASLNKAYLKCNGWLLFFLVFLVQQK